MLIDVDNVNQAESTKWVRHILKNTYDTCLISNFSREIDWEWSQICQRPPSHAKIIILNKCIVFDLVIEYYNKIFVCTLERKLIYL